MSYFLNNRKAHAVVMKGQAMMRLYGRGKKQIDVRMDLDSLQHLEKLGLLKQGIVS